MKHWLMVMLVAVFAFVATNWSHAPPSTSPEFSLAIAATTAVMLDDNAGALVSNYAVIDRSTLDQPMGFSYDATSPARLTDGNSAIGPTVDNSYAPYEAEHMIGEQLAKPAENRAPMRC